MLLYINIYIIIIVIIIYISLFGNENSFFEFVIEDKVATGIKNIPICKASVSNDIPVSIMKETIDAHCPKVTEIRNDYLKINFFLIY